MDKRRKKAKKGKKKKAKKRRRGDARPFLRKIAPS